MPKRRKFKHVPVGLSDAQDGTNAFQGAMSLLQNLIPATTTPNMWTPRPAAIELTDFSTCPGVTTPTEITVALSVGTVTYGLVSDANDATDHPFAYDSSIPGFVTITANGVFPTTQPTTGDWTPPTMTLMPNGRIIICHIGYPGTSGRFFGVIDTGSITINITADTHSTTLLDNLDTGAFNPLVSGVEIGMTVSGSGIPAGNTVASFTATTITMHTNATTSLTATPIVIAGGTRAAPTYASINTNGTALASVPVGCGLSPANRAMYLTGNNVVLSDSLHSSQVTNANQVLTIGDSQPCTAISQQAFTSQTQGGGVAANIVFKGDGVPFQITGDFSTSNLLVNNLNAPAGTLAANTLAPTPMGLMFMSQDGLRYIDPFGVVRGPIGLQGSGVNQPFLNVVNPSRMCAAYNANTYRVSLAYKYLDATDTWQTTTAEFWYHFGEQEASTPPKWSGPHTFPYAILVSSQSDRDHGFIGAALGIDAKLWYSTATPTPNSTYTENGAALTWDYRTTLVPDAGSVAMHCWREMNVMIALGGAGDYNFRAYNENMGLIDQAITLSPAQWNVSKWNQAFWATTAPAQVPIWWTQPWVFQQCFIDITGPSAAGVVIGNLYSDIEDLGYTSATFRIPLSTA